MIEPKQVFILLLTVGFVSYSVACETLGLSRRPLIASLRTDSAEIGVQLSEYTYHAKIGFVYVNTSSGPVAKAGCGFPPLPGLEKKVDGKWVEAYYPVYAACLTKPDYTLPSGGTYHGVLQFLAFQPGHQAGPELRVDSIDGVYRLEWDFVEGTDVSVKNARRVNAISNEFRMVLTER
jgi:hypothetical protein